jgi:carbon storage regulator
MLVLSRRINETIMIGDNVAMTILSCSDNRVKVGLTAPKDVPIHRKEIYDLIQRASEQAEKEG